MPGADGAVLTSIVATTAGGSATAVGTNTVVNGQYGDLTISSDGSYSYQSTPNAVLRGAVADIFTYTITDGDGDTSTTTLTINISDSGLATPNYTVTVDEAALDLNQDGDDLVAGTVTGSLPGSTDETDGGTAVATGGTHGYTYALVGSPTGTYGTIEVLANGDYTYTLSQNYLDGLADNAATTIDSLVTGESFTYVATDSFGNTTTGTISIDIVDDVPVDFQPFEAFVLNKAGEVSILDLEFAEAVGADEPGSVVFSLVDGSEAMDNGNTLSLNGDTIYLYGDGTTMLTGTTDITGSDPSQIVFTVDLDVANDTYEVTVLQAEISNGVGFSQTDISSGVSGGNVSFVAIGANTNDGSVDILLSSPSGLSVNTSQGRIGLGSANSIDDNETLQIDFLINVDQTLDGTGDFPAGDGFFADDRFGTTSFEQEVNRINGQGTASLLVTVALVDTDPLTNDPDITRVVIRAENGNTVFDTDINLSGTTFNGVTVELLNNLTGDATIVGIEENWTYFIETNGDFNRVDVAGFDSDGFLTPPNDDDAPFTLGAFTLGGEPFEPFTLDTDIVGSDEDGDSVTSTINVTFLPADSGDNFVGTENDDAALNGNANDNTIAGLGGADIINGLAGNDTMTGGAGADVFVVGLDSLDFAIEDIISDYNFAEGDEIDLTELLERPGGTQLEGADGASYVYYNRTAGDVIDDDNGVTGDLIVDSTGHAGFGGGDVVANLGSVVTSITILFDDGSGNSGSDII